MLRTALKAQACGLVARFSEDLLADGRQRMVRHGAGPERGKQTGIGPIEVRRRRVRDRATALPVKARVRFTSNILPKPARRSKTLRGSVFPPNERLGCHVGIRESAQSWRESLVGITARVLAIAPQVAVGDGAPG